MATASFTKGFWVFHNVFTFMLHSTAFVTITLIAGSTVEGFGLKPLHKHTVCAYTHTIANAQTYARVYQHRHTYRHRGVCGASCLLVVAVMDAALKKIVQKGRVWWLLGCLQHIRKSNCSQGPGSHWQQNIWPHACMHSYQSYTQLHTQKHYSSVDVTKQLNILHFKYSFVV